MKSPILVAFVSLLACSRSQLSTEVDRSDAGTSDIGASDAGSDVGAGDIGASEAGSDVGAGGQPLCDGVRHLRLSAAYLGGGEQAPASTVSFENGYPLFAVDGTCSYWIGGGWTNDALSRDLPLRTGKLSDADTRVLEEAFPLGDIAALGEGCTSSSIPDAPIRLLRTETALIPCGDLRSSPAADRRFDVAWMALRTVAARLWEDGTPMKGALHVSAFGPASVPPTPISPPAYAWPLSLPLSSFVIDARDWSTRGVSRLVDDPDSAGHLHALRDQYLADRTAQPGLYGIWSGLITTDQISTAIVYMRDAIPYEDAQGLLEF